MVFRVSKSRYAALPIVKTNYKVYEKSVERDELIDYDIKIAFRLPNVIFCNRSLTLPNKCLRQAALYCGYKQVGSPKDSQDAPYTGRSKRSLDIAVNMMLRFLDPVQTVQSGNVTYCPITIEMLHVLNYPASNRDQ